MLATRSIRDDELAIFYQLLHLKLSWSLVIGERKSMVAQPCQATSDGVCGPIRKSILKYRGGTPKN